MFRLTVTTELKAVPYDGIMPPRVGQDLPLGRCYIREWRQKNNLSQDRLVERLRERLGTFSKSSLSRIENSLQPYSQPILEAVAWALNCEPGDLLKPVPKPETELQSFVRRLNEREQDKALRLLRAALTEEAA